MPRPAKSVTTISKNLTKDEKRKRMEVEEKLRGQSDNVSPPSHLNQSQRNIFNYIVDELKASEILGNLDIYILTSLCIAIERLQEIETSINEDSNKLLDKSLMSAKKNYTQDLITGIRELSLSPSSRAKIGNINLQKKAEEDDPILQILRRKNNPLGR